MIKVPVRSAAVGSFGERGAVPNHYVNVWGYYARLRLVLPEGRTCARMTRNEVFRTSTIRYEGVQRLVGHLPCTVPSGSVPLPVSPPALCPACWYVLRRHLV